MYISRVGIFKFMVSLETRIIRISHAGDLGCQPNLLKRLIIKGFVNF